MKSSRGPRPIAREFPYFPLMMLIHSCSALIDAAVTVTLASSALFAVKPSEARLSILLSLVGTLLPFILLAPSATFLVEKIRTPRITVAIAINALRFVGLVLMALASAHSSSTRLAIFPLAFVMLTLSKCYVVAKTSALPQVTTTENFPYFSSRLSMATGIISVVAGSLLFAIYRIFSPSTTLFFSAFVSLIAIGFSAVSYVRLRRRIHLQTDKAASRDVPHDASFDPISDLSLRNRTRAIKSLFTYSCAIRFAVGVVTIGIGLKFRTDEFVLGACFFGAAVSSFITNGIAVVLNRSRIAPFVNYLVLGILGIFAVLLTLSSTSIAFIVISFVLGGAAAYSRVVYESRAAHIVPLEFSGRILARGEVWMQFAWVVGAGCAVISYTSIALGLLCLLATVLSVWAYASTISVSHRTKERF